jgi:hypothetical protein
MKAMGMGGHRAFTVQFEAVFITLGSARLGGCGTSWSAAA